MEDLEYIKRFSKITITKACKICKVNRSNLLNGKANEEDVKKVKKELEHQVAKLYIKKEEE